MAASKHESRSLVLILPLMMPEYPKVCAKPMIFNISALVLALNVKHIGI